MCRHWAEYYTYSMSSKSHSSIREAISLFPFCKIETLSSYMETIQYLLKFTHLIRKLDAQGEKKKSAYQTPNCTSQPICRPRLVKSLLETWLCLAKSFLGLFTCCWCVPHLFLDGPASLACIGAENCPSAPDSPLQSLASVRYEDWLLYPKSVHLSGLTHTPELPGRSDWGCSFA